MKIIITTSDRYHHCLPVFFHCYNKRWGDPFTIVGYKQPKELPDNCIFISLGKQRGPDYFSDDMHAFFKDQPQWFVWMMEDTFIKSFNRDGFNDLVSLTKNETGFNNIGRINLTNEGMKREHKINNGIYYCHPQSLYRLSTQPSIWNRNFLLHYMTPGFTPWKFETQETSDDYMVIGPVNSVVDHNEGVRKNNIHKLNMEGLGL